MNEPLFELGDWAGDPLRPGWDRPTPAELVAKLTRPDRSRRLAALIEQAHAIVDLAISEHFQRHELTAACLLWSGGKDSNVLAHLMRPRATCVVHANTGIGIEATRQHVRDHAAAWGLELLEFLPDPGDGYEDFVLEFGFPGPGQHHRVYQRLKERAFEKVQKRFNQNPHRQRVLFFAGRRRDESDIRAGRGGQPPIPLTERRRSRVWSAPIANWTKLDMNQYLLEHPDTPKNWVADLMHMSAECLCGSKAHRGELDYIRQFFPAVAAYLDDLGARARANGVHPDLCVWGWGADSEVKQRVSRRARLSDLCGTCPTGTLFETLP